MKIIEEIKKSVYAKYQTSTLFTVDQVAFYMDHVPQAVSYPCVVFYHIASNNFMAMANPSKTEGFDYVDSIFQFSIYSNDRQHVQAEDIADRIEDLYHRQSLTMSNSVSHIGTIVTNSRTKFWDQSQKIWHISQDYRILAGR